MQRRLKLLEPGMHHEEQVMEYRREMMEETPGYLHGCAGLENCRTFNEWLDFDENGRQKYGASYVPADVYLAFRNSDGRLVGMIEFRHPANQTLLAWGGHIGYSVRPSERHKGYATEMLAQLLPICRESGERRVMLSCEQNNIASRNVIQTNGGIFEQEIQTVLEDGALHKVQKYWITLSQRTPNPLLNSMMAIRDRKKIAVLSNFFKTGPGEYGEGDHFLGIKVPDTRMVVKQCKNSVTFDDLDECLHSPFHEIRLAGLLALIQRFKHSAANPALQKRCIDFYLAHTGGINNWDLVDLSCYELLGTWLLDKERSLLYDLAQNGKTIWEQRIAIVSTMQFIRHGEYNDTLAIAERLITHSHDLIHKAVGWLLREVGKHDKTLLADFLSKNYNKINRTTLRYAIEHFSCSERRRWLTGNIKISQ